MKTKTMLFLLAGLFIILTACTPKEAFQTGENYHGFTLEKKKFVEEVNAECLLFRHDKSGARLLKIAADDPNKLFNIAFKTTPETDCGTPHIMEHSVLNGSKNFPVKSPFDVLMKGSLNTFLNAMTGSDMTTYPVASMNDKDYFNLMHVYLDAVFNPLIYDDPRILQQEGWHHELDKVDGDVVYKGVVYNEMKGAFSSPSRELSYQVYKNLFPDNSYGYSSGGYPAAIPELSYDYFVNFHKKYYHPGNSYILLYGDADLKMELEFIDSAYLSSYDLSDQKVEIPLQKPFDKMKEDEKTYAVPEGAPTDNQTFLRLSFVVGSCTDRTLAMTFDVLSDALVNHESAPLRLALQEAGVGKDVSAYFSEAKQNVFHITVRNADPEDRELFKETVFNTLKKVAAEGFDKAMTEGIINRTEFYLKEENTSQKGLRYFNMSYQSWFFAEDPFLGLEFNKPLEEVKKALGSDLLESAIEDHLMSNQHALLMVLKPEPGLQAKADAATADELAEFKAGLSDTEKEELILKTSKLIEHQKREDSPEQLATVPMLELSDISTEVEWFDIEEKNVDGVTVLHHNEFTNNIIYSNLYFDVRNLPLELVPYAKLLTTLLGKMNTENYTFGELDNEINIHTGGIYTYLTSFSEDYSDEKLLPKFIVSAKAVGAKSDKLYGLTEEIMNKSKLDDKKRLKELLTRHQARVDANIKNNGLGYAMTRLESYHSNKGMYFEMTSGLDYYNFVSDLNDNFDEKADEIVANLQKTAGLLFARNNMIAAVTCNEADYSSFEGPVKEFIALIPESSVDLKKWTFDFKKKNEGLMTASKVQYVVKGYDYKKLGFEYSGKMRVLNQVISRDWLQNQVRVIGGAYGGFSGISKNGNVYFASYRDPNLSETIENYDNTPDYLEKFEADEKSMTRFIIGTISRMDRPLTASQKGTTAVRYYFENESEEDLKADRAAVLNTSVEDIRAMKEMISKVLEQDALCVYGNDTKIKDSKEVFKELIAIGN